MPASTPNTVIGWLRRRAAETPDRIHSRTVFQDRPDATLSYGELERRSRQYAGLYARSGVVKGDVVAILLEHSEDLMPAFHGAQWIGAVPAFLQYPTARLNLERYLHDLSLLLERSKPRVILVFPSLRDALAGKLPGRAALLVPQNIRPEDLAGEPASLDAEDVSCIQYSSGSTGLQKGAALSHRAVLNEITAAAEYYHFDAGTRFATWLPLYHDWGVFMVALASVVVGGEYTLLAPAHWIGRPVAVFEQITRHRATCYWLPNFAFNYSAQRIKDSELDGIDLSSLTVVGNGAEPCFHESHEMFARRFARVGLRREALAITYGMAEVVNMVIGIGGVGNEPIHVDPIDRRIFQEERRAVPVADDHPDVQRMLSSGRVLRGTEFRLVDDSGAEVPERVVGEVWFRSNAVMHGYHGSPEATAAVLRDGWYVTGDLAYRVGDLLYVTGRKKDLIILGGNNIYPQDVEELVGSHPQVVAGRVAALGVLDREAGTQKLIVIAEARTQDPEARRDIVRFVRREVQARLNAHVERVYLAPPKWLIKTSSGKIARQPNLQRLHEFEKPAG